MGKKRCYGREWESAHPLCKDCLEEYECQDICLGNKRRRTSARSSSKGEFLPNENQVDYSYRTNKHFILPAPGEHPAARLGKNMLAGLLSSTGGEFCCFFQEYRFPPKAEEPVEVGQTEQPDSRHTRVWSET